MHPACSIIGGAADGGGPDPSGAPAQAATVLLSDRIGTPVLLATTADARQFLRRRLTGEGPDAGARRARTDLHAIVARAEVWTVGSALEADLTFLEVARARLPATAEALTERWRSWFIYLDPSASAPAWRKTNLGDLASLASGPPGDRGVDPACLIGPIATKEGAGRFGEALDDAFDLCRFPRELALAPRGTPCAYKEMGRCPAPCEGSESMDRYRGRVREAVATLRLDPSARARASGLDAAMSQAAAAQEFERAAGLRSRIERLEAMGKPALREARPLDTFRFLAILGSGRAGWARLWRIDAWSCRAVADVDASRPSDAVALAREVAAACAGSARVSASHRREAGVGADQPRPPDPVLLGIVGRHLLAPAARRRGGFVRLGSGAEAAAASLDRAGITRLLRGAARLDRAGVEEFDRATLAP